MRGDRLKSLRESRGLTQEELASHLGVSEPQIWRYEKSESVPRADIVLKTAVFFGVSTDYLLGNSDFAGVLIDNKLSPRESTVLAALRRGDNYEAIKLIVAYD